MANAAEFLARWRVRYVDAEGRILEELDTTVAECVEDANEEGFSPRRFRPSSGRRPEGLHSRSHREGTTEVIPRGTPRVASRVSLPPTNSTMSNTTNCDPSSISGVGGRSLAPAASAYTSTMVSFPPIQSSYVNVR